MREFTPLQIDTLTEIINIGVGVATDSLNRLIGKHIVLSVPYIRVMYVENLMKADIPDQDEVISAVVQRFSGDNSGLAALTFSPENAVKLVSVLTNEELDIPDLDPLTSGTLTEIGNIVLGAILSTVSNLLEVRFEFQLPEYRKTELFNLISDKDNRNRNGIIIFTKANFSIKDLALSGDILIVNELNDIDRLISKIDKYIQKVES